MGRLWGVPLWGVPWISGVRAVPGQAMEPGVWGKPWDGGRGVSKLGLDLRRVSKPWG